MSYRICYRSLAKAELNDAMRYSQEFAEQLAQWVQEIGITAPCKNNRSIDVQEMLEEASSYMKHPSSAKHVWQKWFKSSLYEKALALLTLVKKRRPPWELKASVRWFYRILGVFDCEIIAFYEVDHVNKQVVFTKFEGLPGQG